MVLYFVKITKNHVSTKSRIDVFQSLNQNILGMVIKSDL